MSVAAQQEQRLVANQQQEKPKPMARPLASAAGSKVGQRGLVTMQGQLAAALTRSRDGRRNHAPDAKQSLNMIRLSFHSILAFV